MIIDHCSQDKSGHAYSYLNGFLLIAPLYKAWWWCIHSCIYTCHTKMNRDDFEQYDTIPQVENRLRELDRNGLADALTRLNAQLRIAQILSNEGQYIYIYIYFIYYYCYFVFCFFFLHYPAFIQPPQHRLSVIRGKVTYVLIRHSHLHLRPLEVLNFRT